MLGRKTLGPDILREHSNCIDTPGEAAIVLDGAKTWPHTTPVGSDCFPLQAALQACKVWLPPWVSGLGKGFAQKISKVRSHVF